MADTPFIAMKAVGAAKAIEKIEKAINRGNTQLIKAITTGVNDIEADAKIFAPVDKGFLQTSITHEVKKQVGGSILGKVGSNLSYAPYVEYGAEEGKQPRGKGRMPYLYPAFAKNFENIRKMIQAAMKGMAK